MVDFDFTEEQLLVRKTVREFCEREIIPYAQQWDSEGKFPRETLKKMARLGLLGLSAPLEYGGVSYDYVTSGIVHEEIGRADPSIGTVFYVHNLALGMISKLASKEIKEKWMPKLIAGEKIIGIALTEPGFGSDFASIVTKAVKENNYYIINGEKICITGAAPDGNDLFIVFVRTGPEESKHRGISAILVDMDAEGIERYRLEDMGLKSTGFGGIRFDNVKVPTTNLIGEENRGFYYVMDYFNPGRPLYTLIAIGAAERAIELAAEYAKQRIVFGKPLAKYEDIQFKIAKNHMNLEAAKLLCYKALWLADNGRTDELIKIHAMAKWFGVEASIKAVDDAMQIHGAIGYTSEYPIEKLFRDIRGFGWADGSTEIMKIIVAREILGSLYKPY